MLRATPNPTAVPPASYEIVQVDHLFCLMVADSNLEHCTPSLVVQNVNGPSILRPTQPAHGPFGELGPFLRLEFEQQQLHRVSGECKNGSAIRGPSGREETL